MIGHLDCSTGVSGDKFLGALLDAGTATGAFTVEHLAELVSQLAPEARVIARPVRSHGLASVGVHVEASEDPHHRTWASIRTLLADANMDGAILERSLAAFELLAQAEARAHGVAVEEVHFHEVGALDSIVDVVGVCAGLAALGVESLTATPPATGWGTVSTSHGVLPVPAPATAYLLEGVPTVPGPSGPGGAAPGELTTPTGAALLRACVQSFGAAAPMTPRAIGYGAGTRDIGHPNVCRIILGDPAPQATALAEEAVTLLETNIDHISPEAGAFACEQLLAEGALDVWTAPITMKKGRAAFALSALVATSDAERVAERLVALSGTLGVRRTQIERFVTARDIRQFETPFGSVRVKLGAGRWRAEADDIARIARENGVSFNVANDEIGAFLALERLDP